MNILYSQIEKNFVSVGKLRAGLTFPYSLVYDTFATHFSIQPYENGFEHWYWYTLLFKIINNTIINVDRAVHETS